LKFLGQAKKFFKGLQSEPEPTTQHFNVRCISGHRVRGERTEGYQALRCPACGEGVFVLPRSPLPAPPAPQRQAAAKSGRADGRMVEEGPVELTDPARVSVDLGGDEHVPADGDIVWDDALPEPPPRVVPRPADPLAESVDLGIAGPPRAAGKEPRTAPEAGAAAERRHRNSKPRRRESQAATGERVQSAAAGVDRRAREPKAVRATAGSAAPGAGHVEKVLEIKPARRMPTLHRLLLVVVPCLVIATVALRYRQNLRQEYPAIVERGRTDGIKALEEGEFDKANQLLSAARSAVDGLGGAVEGADDVRQAADEAAIFVKLIPQDLGDLLDEAGQTDKLSWASRFDTVYKGRSIFVDSIQTAVPDGTPSSRYELLLRILPPGEATKRDGRPALYGVIDLTGFQLLEMAARPLGERVIFGARLKSFAYEDNAESWVVRLEPKSGVFITHTKALDSLGWREDSTPAKETVEDQP
jgi:hypothetical protein